jgi:hypothetical protein
VRRVVVEDRIVALCPAHAASFEASGATTIAELRNAFLESAGHRSLVGQRSPLDRRVFPPRPEGRRRGDGRRASDD